MSEVSAQAQEWLLSHRAKIFAHWVRPEQTVLEFGPRDPWNLRAIQAREKHACFPRTDRVQLEKEGVHLVEEAAGLPNAIADLVLCYNVLEYQLEPRDIIVELKRALKPEGIISVYALYDPDFRKPRFDRVAEHYFSWNVQTLGNLLIDCGFSFLQGGVHRYPREELLLKSQRHFKLAAFWSRLFDPFEQVHVVAKNST